MKFEIKLQVCSLCSLHRFPLSANNTGEQNLKKEKIKGVLVNLENNKFLKKDYLHLTCHVPAIKHTLLSHQQRAASDTLKSLNNSRQSISLSLDLVNHARLFCSTKSHFKNVISPPCNRTQEEQFKGFLFVFFLL